MRIPYESHVSPITPHPAHSNLNAKLRPPLSRPTPVLLVGSHYFSRLDYRI